MTLGYLRTAECQAGGGEIYLTLVLKWSHCSWFTEKLIFLSLSYHQVNMVIGILVFNKLVSRDGILDKKLKHRAGYDSTSLLVPPLFFFTSCNKYALIFPLIHMEMQTSFFLLLERKWGINIKRSDLSRERRGFILFLAESVQDENHLKRPHTGCLCCC